MTSELPMVVEEDFPLYVVADEESGGVLVAAEEVEGFFVDPGEEAPEVIFLRAHEVNMGRRRSEDAVLRIVNRRREKIGEYLIGRVVLGDVGKESSDGKISSVPYRFFGDRCEYPGAARIWRRWALAVAMEKGEWLQWPASHHGAWLHVVQNAWFASNHRAVRYGADDVVHLDGAQISTKPGFFCALGEAVNGPGGYFGSNLDAMADCISSSFREGSQMKIVWQDFRMSQESLGRAFVDSVMEVMREFKVDVAIC
ncbi:barstar family protein [Frankia sp. CNm7]|uniref:Barstar family protein n=1 Tax=Frankia nepalensis TaxID=1836974 RepID=A0A937ULP5_9ACTN|nr:barstar family protein [Frankia nepalensis]MBL7498718.1 barstar family protein [Frankia nepalensis]MBL7508417.1 barstar family protein [Frankia nepalensis]MBL7522435.1 barstar family protein [Frankia nepalensis]MBL7626248.1 barstar family protein [Frankia nepalensis]